MSKRALIIVDVQNDFINGSLAVDGGDDAARAIANMDLSEYNYVVRTRDWHPSNWQTLQQTVIPSGANTNRFTHFSHDPDFKDTWPPHCVALTPGSDYSPHLKGMYADEEFFKGQEAAAYSGFEGRSARRWGFRWTLKRWLKIRGVDEVDVVGIATDYCVKATAIDAANLGFYTTVLVDYTAWVSDVTFTTALDEMRAANVSVIWNHEDGAVESVHPPEVTVDGDASTPTDAPG